MSDLSVLEKELNKLDETRRDMRTSDIETEHFSKMHENYEKLVYAPVDFVTEVKSASPVASATPSAPAAPTQAPMSNYQRSFADYVRYEARESRGTGLFEGVEYRDIAWGQSAPAEESKVETKAKATVAAADPTDEDAIPTRRTMDTIRRGEHASVAEAVHTSFLSALTPRLKTALVAVAVAIIVAIILVMVNAGIIKSLDGRISLRESEIDHLEQQATEILSEIESLSDPENVSEWAEAHGMMQS